ncbi:MAG TPA: lectin-like protein [Flavobacteriales bacterium]|nr:lectin-like protein [Flavobacteriales bacterium]
MKKITHFVAGILTIGFLAFTQTLEAQVNLGSGLVAYFPLNGNAQDFSGNGNNGTGAGTVNWVNDRFGNPNSAVGFGGTGSPGKITVPHSASLNFSTGASFAFWVRVNSNVGTFGNGSTGAGGSQCLFAKEGDAGGGLWSLARITGGGLPHDIGVNGMTTLTGTHTPYTTGTWVHYVVTMDASGHQVYINGVQTAFNTHPANFTAMVNRNLVLGRFNSNWYPLNGHMDEFRVYNRVLTNDEITALATDDLGSITSTPSSAGPYCAGDALSVSYNATGNSYLAGNVFQLQMSDASGSFSNPVIVATATATSGTYNTQVPTGTPSGAGYKFRVSSTLPLINGTESAAMVVNGVLGDIPSSASFRYIGNVSGRNYYMSLNAQTWNNSSTLCSANGGHLAHIPNQEVNDYLQASAPSSQISFIGLTDVVTEGLYIWQNNYAPSFTNWATGQPDNASNEDFVELRHSDGMWNDRNGTMTRNCIMQLNPAGNDLVICEGANIALGAAPLTGATYLWTGPNSFSSTQQNPIISNASSVHTGTYSLVITKGGCSSSAQTVNVTVVSRPVDIGQTSALPSSLSSGLILHYPFNGNANDASGGGNNGTLQGGVTPIADRFGSLNSALALNGTTGHITVPSGAWFDGGPFTVSAWVRKSSNNNFSRLLDFGNGQANNNVVLAISSGTSGRPLAQFYQGTTGGAQVSSPVTVLTNNEWELLTYTYENNAGRIYIDGILVGQGTQTAPINVVRAINYIGRSNWASDGYANARFDDFRIYNRVLSLNEIIALVAEQPTVLSVYAMPSTLCASATSQIVLKSSQPGISYQLQNAATSANIGTVQMGTGDSLVFVTGTIAATTSFQLVAVSSITNCSRILSPAVTVNVIPTPTAPVTTGDQVCNEGTMTLSATGAPGGANYNWYTAPTGGTPLAGETGNSISTGLVDESVSYYVSYTDVNGCESPRTIVTGTVINPLNPPVDIVSGLILHYTFDGNVNDYSGNGYNGTVNGTNNYVNDRLGNANSALNTVSGSTPGNNFINSGNPAKVQQLTNQVTISMWIRQTQTWFGSGDGYMPLVNKWDGTGMYTGLYMTNPSNMQNRVRWRINGSLVLNSSQNVPVGEWHHIVCTYNGAQLRIYQNGVLTGTLNHTGNIPNTGVNLEMGRQANGVGDITYRGDWDQVKVYNRALNLNEAQTLYNNESVAFANDPLCDGEDDLQLSTFNFPGATYQWSGPNGFTSNVQNPPVITNADSATYSGVYTLLVTAQGCTSPPQQTTVTIYQIPSAPSVVNDTVCGSGNAVLQASGAPTGASYAWYTVPSGGTPISGQTGSSLTLTGVTTTTVRYVSIVRNSCEGPRTAVTAVYNNPVSTGLTVNGSSVCISQSQAAVTILASQTGVNYQAFFGGNPVSAIVPGGGDILLSVNTSTLSTGNNTITIVASQAGCGNVNLTNTATVQIYAAPSATISASGSTDICIGQSVTLTASTGTSYLWNNGSVSNAITVSVAGNYSVTITDANGCSATSATVELVTNAVPNPVITPAGALSFCQGGSVVLNASGGTTYQWSTGATGNSVTVSSSQQVTLTAFNGGCSAVSSPVDVIVIPAPSVGISASATSVCPGVSVTLNGTGAQSYTWNNGVANGVSFSPATSQTYTVTGSDANGCTNTAQITITVLPGANATFSASTPTVCPGADVQLTANASGLTQYDWYFNGSPLQMNGPSAITVSTPGDYELQVVDNNGCTGSFAMNIGTGSTPTASISSTGTSFCQGSNLLITANLISGSVYQWYVNGNPVGGATVNGNTFSATTAGMYTVEITNSNGCSALSNAIALTTTAGPLASIQSSGTLVCPGDSVYLSADFVSGATYQWYFNGTPISGATLDHYYAVAAGTYSAEVTDGCTSVSNNITLTSGSAPSNAGSISGATSECSGESLMYSIASVSGATSYQWSVVPANAATIHSGQGTNSVLINTTNQNFTLSVTPVNSCGNGGSSSLAVSVTNAFPCSGEILFGAYPTLVCQGNNVVFTNYTNSMLFPGFTPRWNFGAGASPATANGNGPHTVTYSSTGQKTVTLEYVDMFGFVVDDLTKINYINVSAPVATGVISGNTTISCSSNLESYSVNATAGSSYQWSVPAGAVIVSGQGTSSVGVNWNGASGTISVIETNASGCAGTAAQLNVNISNPVLTSSISGSATVACTANGQTYSVTPTSGSTYLWNVPAGVAIVSGQGTSSIVVDFSGSAGTITVTETNAAGCTGAPQTLLVNCTNDISENRILTARIYPNPTAGMFRLEWGSEGEVGQLQLYNALGAMVYSEMLGSGSDVNISILTPGIYTGRLESAGSVYQFKVIKQ